MTINEFKEINDKYNCSMMFSNKLEAMSKEEYRERIEWLYNAIINDDSDKEKENG